jgi:hypothetical protein
MKLPPDVVTYVRARFPADEWEAVTATLMAACIHTGEFPGERLLRCAVIASEGDLLRLQYYVGLLAIDWRDVIVAGEYVVQEHGLAHVRNLCEPIPSETAGTTG